MAKIKSLFARQVLDGNGYPTLEGKLTLDSGIKVETAISSGLSYGKNDLLELRDNDPNQFLGHGVQRAVQFVNQLIGPKILGVDVDKHLQIDQWLINADGTENRSRLGVNTINLVSQLTFKAASQDKNLNYYQYINYLYNKQFNDKIIIQKIPSPIFTVITGGKYGKKNLDFQEFQIVPATYLSFSEALEKSVAVFHELGEILQYRNTVVSFGIDGSYNPNLSANVDAFEIIKETLLRKKFQIGLDIFFGLDVAANHFYTNGYYLIKDHQSPLKSKDFFNYLFKINNDYNLLILEDPFSDGDIDSWKNINKEIGETTYIIGDDIIPSNLQKLKKIFKDTTISAATIKINRFATIKELLECVNLLRNNNIKIIFSHRSKEVNDSLIADLAVGLQSDFIKFGPPNRGERVIKYNRLLEIETELKENQNR